MGDELLVAGVVDQEVDVRGTEVTDVRPADQVTDRTVHRDRVAAWRDGAHAVRAVRSRPVQRAQPGLVDLRQLRLVGAVGVGLPYVQDDVGQRRAVEVEDPAGDEQRRARDAVRHVGSESGRRRAVDVKGTEHRRRSGLRREVTVQLDDERAQTEDVGGEDELLTLVVTDPAGRREPLDGRRPLLLRQPDLAGVRVEVPHQRRHQLGEPGRVSGGPPLHRQVAEVVLRHEGHGILLGSFRA